MKLSQKVKCTIKCTVYMFISRVKHETNEMEVCETSPQLLITSFTCADKFTAFGNMLLILTFRVLFAICFVFKRFCVSCHLIHACLASICCHVIDTQNRILFLLRVHVHFSVPEKGSSVHQIPMKKAQ